MTIQKYLQRQDKLQQYNPASIIKYLERKYKPTERSADNKINSQSKNMDEEKTEETTPAEGTPEEEKTE